MAQQGAGGRDCAPSPLPPHPMHVDLARLTSDSVLQLRAALRRVTALHVAMPGGAAVAPSPIAAPPAGGCPVWQDTVIDVRQVTGTTR